MSKTWTKDAREKAAQRSRQVGELHLKRRLALQDRGRRRIGDDVGTGPAHSAYVEIRERRSAP